jgi:hypothetical protein
MKHLTFFGLCILHLTINAQNVGINKTNPQYPLDVHGIINTDATYHMLGYPVLKVDPHDNLFVGKFAAGAGVTVTGDHNTILGSAALGPHFGSARGTFSGTSSKPLSTAEQNDLRDKLAGINIPLTDKTVEVNANNDSLKIDGPWGGMRFTIGLGVRF